MSSPTVRTRFAPSPTGYLHIGSARTALFCYLFARQQGGEFVLRIEDTDRARSTEESVQAIFDGMAWLGLDYDAGPFYQTKRFDRYKEVVQELLDAGHAYRCYCTPAELDTMREEAMRNKQKPRYNGYWRDRTESPPAGIDPVIRFRNPLEGDVVFNDAVKGEIRVSNQELDDLVIMRSDGVPTYNLVVSIDDSDMNITHVIRGDDHVNNTPRQINILNAMGVELPTYAHLPMILGEDGKRLSKRHGAVSVMQYNEDGILPKAMLNYLARLGWSHGDQELFSLEEMIKLFSLESVNRSGAVFDNKKLAWVNQQHIQSAEPEELAAQLERYLQAQGVKVLPSPALADVAGLLRERAKNLNDMADAARYFYEAPTSYDPKAQAKQLTEDAAPRLQAIRDAFANLPAWEAASIDETIRQTVAQLEVGFGKIGLPLRVAVTGNTASPALDQTLELIGRESVIARLDTAMTHCK